MNVSVFTDASEKSFKAVPTLNVEQEAAYTITSIVMGKTILPLTSVMNPHLELLPP